MGLITACQKHAYLLKPGENDAPGALKAAWKNTNRLQDMLFSSAREIMPAKTPYDAYMAERKAGFQVPDLSLPARNARSWARSVDRLSREHRRRSEQATSGLVHVDRTEHLDRCSGMEQSACHDNGGG